MPGPVDLIVKLKIYGSATYVAHLLEAIIWQLMLILILSGSHHLAKVALHKMQCIVQKVLYKCIQLQPNETTTWYKPCIKL